MNSDEWRAEVRQFLDEALSAGRFRPAVDNWVQGIDPDFSRELADRGWVGMAVPKEYGGRGESALRRWVVTDELLAAGAPVAAHWIGDRQIAPSLLRHGTEAQKQKYLPGIASGELFFALGMSESEAGSDLAAIKTRAVRDGAGWRLSGAKLWTSHAQIAHAVLVLARTEPVGDSRHAGMSQFLVDIDTPGVTVRPIRTIDGKAHFNELIFDDVLLAPEALLGAEGAGWSQVTAELAYERSGPERIESTVPLLLAWGRTIEASDQRSREEFAGLMARLAVLRHMSFGIAQQLDRGQVPDTDAAMVKALGGDFEQQVVSVVSRLAGCQPSFTAERSLADHLAYAITHAPTFTIRGGASDILRGIVAKGVGLR
ncbi:acyl-CoA dehydrogenase family protein [Nocardia sp. NPDC004278]